ncbi:MAG: tRNA sulfurtransferase [Crenarchaeota archaeon]|nr:tRNA sulfurtransferase [Thermoproteota archaeon]
MVVVEAAPAPGRVVAASLSGEIVLKGPRTRPRFERRLLRNAAAALERWGLGGCRVRLWETRLLVEGCGEEAAEAAVDALLHVFGVHAVTVAHVIHYEDIEDLVAKAAAVAAEWVRGRRFAVRARRSGREPFTSLELARRLGAALHPYSAGVDLEEPEVEVYIEARGRVALLHRGWRRGPGGLPIGVEGRVLALFSGGLDSPLAAWMAAKRGAEVDMLHYILATPLSLADALRVARLEARLWLHGYSPTLYAVDFRGVTRAIAARVRPEYRQVVLRLAMYTAAERLAEAHGYQALVTGESLGQVSSQTLHNIYALAKARPLHVPILRPLIGLDKEEIVEQMRRIGLYDEASRTREYCRLAQGPVTTRADPETLRAEYEKVEDETRRALEALAEIRLA